MAKKIEGYIKLEIPAGQANPSPPVGPALGQRGLNIMEFCKAFNAATQEMEQGMPIPVIITAYADRSFSFITKTPPASFYIKKGGRPAERCIGSRSRDRSAALRRARCGDRGSENAGFERERCRSGDEDHRRHGPLDGRRSRGGLSHG